MFAISTCEHVSPPVRAANVATPISGLQSPCKEGRGPRLAMLWRKQRFGQGCCKMEQALPTPRVAERLDGGVGATRRARVHGGAESGWEEERCPLGQGDVEQECQCGLSVAF